MKIKGLVICTAISMSVLMNALPFGEVLADTNASLWGYSGLLNIPDANVLESRSFYAGLRYFPLNSGLSGVAAISILDDLEASLVFGVPPAAGFSALAASLKYRIIDQNDGQPLSMAVGASLLGLGNTASYVPGSNAFISLSHGIDWQNARLINLHGGFMGGLKGARIFAGLDVPILDIVRFETEYLGVINGFQALNFGLEIMPHPDLAIEMAFMQQPTQPMNFWDRDFSLGISYRGNWGSLLEQPTPQTTVVPVPEATATPPTSLQPPSAQKGHIRVRVIDRTRITALSEADIQLKSPRTGLEFSGKSNVLGEYTFKDIPIDNYEVRVLQEGWNTELRLISVQANLETFIEIPLTGQDAILFGSLEAANNGSLDSVEIELLDLAGKSLRRVQVEGTKYRLEKVPPGTYQLVVFQQNNERLRLTVQARGNMESQFDLNLPPIPVAIATPKPAVPVKPAVVMATIEGQIKLTGAGPMSGVRLELKNDDLVVITLTKADGKYIFRDIPRGTYRMTLTKDGYKRRSFQLTINRTETLEHNFELEPES